jgi:hypothetical protein
VRKGCSEGPEVAPGRHTLKLPYKRFRRVNGNGFAPPDVGPFRRSWVEESSMALLNIYLPIFKSTIARIYLEATISLSKIGPEMVSNRRHLFLLPLAVLFLVLGAF